MKIEFKLLITQNPLMFAHAKQLNPVEVVMMEMEEFKNCKVSKINVSEQLIEIQASNGNSFIYKTPDTLKAWLEKYEKEGANVGPFNETITLEYVASMR